MFLIFDTETTGLPKNFNAPITDTDNWPRVVQLAWQLHDELGSVIEHQDFLIKPNGFNIPIEAEGVHGISTELAQLGGEELEDVLFLFKKVLQKATFIVGHNLKFDVNVLGCEFVRVGEETPLTLPVLDTCTEESAKLVALIDFFTNGDNGRNKTDKYDKPILVNGQPEIESQFFKSYPAPKAILDLRTNYQNWGQVSFENRLEIYQEMRKQKFPTLGELHSSLFNETFAEAHNATADVEATTRCFLELIRKEHYTLKELMQEAGFFEAFKRNNPELIQTIGLTHTNLKEESKKIREAQKPQEKQINVVSDEQLVGLKNLSFGHLHNHSQYSILQSTSEVKELINAASKHGMEAVALTDTGNMMAAFHFEKAASAYNSSLKKERAEAEEKGEVFKKKELLPIIGCEFNVCKNLNDKTQKDNGYQIVILAKNKAGYQNLIKLASIAYTKGMYYVPRIDKQAIETYKNDLIVLSGNLYGEIPNLIMNVGETQAEEALLWWKEQFGEDFYIELSRHNLDVEDRVNATLVNLARKHNVKIVATNNTFYINRSDAEAHDVLLCVKDNELVETQKGRGRGFRFGLENDEYYFKSKDEMISLFTDLPEAIENVAEIIGKCEHYALARNVLLPAFDIPSEFTDPQDEIDGGKRGENNYLRHLTYDGAKKRYPELTDEIKDRIDFELATVEKTGYPGYFLIVQDFCQAARDMGVSVGPGRGSAAGSVVAYCTGITNVDPIKYDLLFERFLNPDRISMPDIDIDFDDEGRGRVIDYVIDKYGANQVAQIITYGTMAAKSAVRDASRVMNLSLPEADRLAKLIPDISLKKLFGFKEEELVDELRNQDEVANARELRRIAEGNDLQGQVLRRAREIEGSVRNTGIHACGVIITPDDLTNFVPVATAKDSDMVCTQYDNSVAESAGLLKMDFLGLKTLTLIKEAVKYVKATKGIDLDPDNFPIEDEKTYELFQRGDTVGIFQYESPGMQKYLKDLKPTKFADLIAMNALYRPGPIEYIPSFIKRKHGEEEIVYDLADCEDNLKETYGITVYQEQVMLLSQRLSDFTKGDADTLRKAMGKKDRPTLDKMKPIFLERGQAKGHDVTKLEKIWKDWEAFASYAFNKSHSTCYAWVAYQTAYLKANFPAEYMASVLSNNMNDIKQVSFFMEECKRMGVPVLGPDINESNYAFTVNKEGAIRFGLGAIKGLGSAPIDAIVTERQIAPFQSIFDLTKRVNLRICNKRAFESLAYAGGFDSFENVHRAQYFAADSSGKTFLENAVKYGASFQESQSSAQASMFGESTGTAMPEPTVPKCDEWPSIYKLNREKEVVGIFISGHPLDDFKLEIESFCKGTVSMLHELPNHLGKDLSIAVVVSQSEHRLTKKGDPFCTITIEDYNDSHRLNIFNENYLRFKHFAEPGAFLVLKGRIDVPRNRKEPEFVLNAVELLHELRDKRTKSIRLKISTKNLDHLLIDKLNELFTSNIGNCQINFIVYDPTEGTEVEMPSRTVKVNPSNDLLKELSKLDLEFNLN
ncbi:MAG: DNA polymerase III subunit alpha [Flavobacteriales bacterium]|nr:DNA polymerase III subunit alpha [Flavobacteriales bacterium]